MWCVLIIFPPSPKIIPFWVSRCTIISAPSLPVLSSLWIPVPAPWCDKVFHLQKLEYFFHGSFPQKFSGQVTDIILRKKVPLRAAVSVFFSRKSIPFFERWQNHHVFAIWLFAVKSLMLSGCSFFALSALFSTTMGTFSLSALKMALLSSCGSFTSVMSNAHRHLQDCFSPPASFFRAVCTWVRWYPAYRRK